MKKNGATGYGFTTVVGSGSRSAIHAPYASEKVIRRRDVVVVDLGPIYDQYQADMTRTIVVGKPSAKQRRMYETVRKAEEKAIDLLVPGTACCNIAEAVHYEVAKGPYGRYSYTIFDVGHGIGLENHESPMLTKINPEKIVNGMTIAVEPIICVPRFGGARSEDTIYVSKDGSKLLTKCTRELELSEAICA